MATWVEQGIMWCDDDRCDHERHHHTTPSHVYSSTEVAEIVGGGSR